MPLQHQTKTIYKLSLAILILVAGFSLPQQSWAQNPEPISVALNGKPVIVLLKEGGILRGTLIDQNKEGVRLLQGSSWKTIPLASVIKVIADAPSLNQIPTTSRPARGRITSPSPKYLEFRRERDSVIRGKILAPTLGIIVPGIGQHTMDQTIFGTALSVVGYTGMGLTAAGVGRLIDSGNVRNCCGESFYHTSLITGIAIWGTAYFTGVVAAMIKRTPKLSDAPTE